MKFSSVTRDSVLQRFHQSCVFGNIIVLMPNPFSDSDRAVRTTANDHTNARWAGISQTSAIDIRD